MNLVRNITIALMIVSILVVGTGLVLIHYYRGEIEIIEAVDTNWEQIETRVEKDIGSIGYQFLTHGKEIPAIEAVEYENCLNQYADLTQVGHEFTREYLLKYNQIVYIRMLRAGIVCAE